MPGRPLVGGLFSGRSISAMLTRVAMASMAVGGLPTTWSPHGSSRDSISINLQSRSVGDACYSQLEPLHKHTLVDLLQCMQMGEVRGSQHT